MGTDVQADFGVLLKHYRLAASLSQEALAERARLSVRAISDLERGARRTPRPETIALLADALGLSATDRATLIAPVLRRRLPAPVPATTPAPAAADTAPSPDMPAPLSGLVGREREIAAVRELLREGARLVTLTGPGGVGKTRLSLQIAADLAPTLREGTAFVDLAALRDPALVAPAIVRTLVHGESSGLTAREALLAHLRSRELLLVLDNFEQITGAGGLVAELAAQCPQLRLLVTSRTALRVRGEQEFPVPPLALPQVARSSTALQATALDALTSYAAVELFVIRAREIRPGFQLTVANAGAVVGICQRLDGLPLAIELAAAQTRVLPPVALLARLAQRLPLLQVGARDLPDRHQTLRATIAWTYDLLDDGARAFFRRLAVFAGSFTLEAIAAICDVGSEETVLEHLVTLIDWQLVRVNEEPDGTARYRLLETIRAYAAEQLAGDPTGGGEEALRERHARHYLDLGAEATPHLSSPAQLAWLVRLDREWDNLRVALGWATARHLFAPLAEAADGLGHLYELRASAEEGEETFRTAATAVQQAADGEPWMRAKLLAWQSVFARLLGRLDEAERTLRQSLVLLDLAERDGREVRAERAFAYLRLGQLDRARGNAEGRADFERSIALYRELGRDWEAGLALWELGRLAYRLSRYEEAAVLQRESLALREACGDRRGVAQVLQSLSQVAAATGQFEDALHLAGRSNDLLHEIGDAADRATGLRHLGQTLAWIGQPGEGRVLLEQSLALYESLGLLGEVGFACYTLCIATIMLGEYDYTERLARRAMAIDREIRSPANLTGDLWMLGMALLGQGRIGEAEAAFREGVVVGRAVVGEGAVVWSLPLLAFVVLLRGDTAQAERHVLDALGASVEHRDLLNALMTMPTAALILAGRGRAERAVELETLIFRYPAIGKNRLASDVWRHHFDAVAATLPPAVAAAARERGQALDLIATLLALPGELAGTATPA